MVHQFWPLTSLYPGDPAPSFSPRLKVGIMREDHFILLSIKNLNKAWGIKFLPHHNRC